MEACRPVRELDAAMGALCGMAVGDALGHPFEYITVSDELSSSCALRGLSIWKSCH